MYSENGMPEEVRISGVRVDSLSPDEVEAALERFVQRENCSLVLNVNVHCLNLAHRNSWLRELLNDAPIVLCDGAGVMIGVRILGNRIRQRIPNTEWIWQLANIAESRGLTLFLLGSRPGVADEAAAKL